jgi:hypothetical protein
LLLKDSYLVGSQQYINYIDQSILDFRVAETRLCTLLGCNKNFTYIFGSSKISSCVKIMILFLKSSDKGMVLDGQKE